MSLSIFNSSPLFSDLRKESEALRRFALRAACFLLLLIAADWATFALLTHGLRRYFSMDREPVVLFVGHSRTVLGIDERRIEEAIGVPTAKYGVNGANTFDRAAMVRQFMQDHPSVRLVVYDVEGSSFNRANLSSNSCRLFFPFIENPVMGKYVRSQVSDPLDYWTLKLFRTSRFEETTLSLAFRGLIGLRGNLKLSNVDLAVVKKRIEAGKTRPVKVEPASLDHFKGLLAFVEQRNAKVMLVDMPTIDMLNRHKADKRKRVRELFGKIAAAHDHVTYVDYSTAYESRHEIFYDAIHLNAKGQRLITDRLTEIIPSLLPAEASEQNVARGAQDRTQPAM